MTDPRAGADQDTALEQAWANYLEQPFRVRIDPAFAAGFAAGLAHAPIAPDPASLARMRRLLWSVVANVDDDFDGFSSVRIDVLEFFGLDPDTEEWLSSREMPDEAE